MASDVPAVAPALWLPFWGRGGTVKESPPHGSGQSCLSPAPTSVAMASPGTQRALFSPGRHRAPALGQPPPFPGRPGDGVGTLLGLLYRVLWLLVPAWPQRVSWGEGGGRILSQQRKAGGGAEIREIIVGVGKMRPGAVGGGGNIALSREKCCSAFDGKENQSAVGSTRWRWRQRCPCFYWQC